MFNFLKKKLQDTVSKFSKKVEEEVEETPIIEEKTQSEKEVKEKAPKVVKPKTEKKKKVEEKPEKEIKTEKIIEKKVAPQKETIEAPEPPKVEEVVATEEIVEKKSGFFKKLFKKKEETEEKPEKAHKSIVEKLTETVTKKALTEKAFEELFFDLEIALLESNVAVEVIEKIKADLRSELVDKKVLRGSVAEVIKNTLRQSVNEVLDKKTINIIEESANKKPYVICFVGINGSGKTTTIAKVVQYLQNNGRSVVLAAADTFRAAAIQQLEEHANNLNVKIIKHDYGSDPAAVGFDAIKYAKQKGIDVVLIDTAGRLHSNINLVEEMKKITRVCNPDLKIFVGESVTGNDCVFQATEFNSAIGIDGIILSKADVDEKGGAALSVAYVTGKPILFIGTGQTYDSLELFDKNKIIESIGL